MIRFLRPEAFLLAPIVIGLLRRRALSTPAATVLRAVVLLALCGLLADPVATAGSTGRDLVVVLDRSHSVPSNAAATADEIQDRVASEARAGDRWGVVHFGRTAVVEGPPREGRVRTAPVRTVEGDGTDLAAAIDAALAAIPPERPGSILLVSDGEATGGDAEAAARRARRRGVRVDAVPLRRAGTFDVAVEEVSVPVQLAVGEPYQAAAWIRSERPVEATIRLLRDGVTVAEGKRTLPAGTERVLFRDAVGEPGIHVLAVEVVGADDRVPENDRAEAPLRVEGRYRVLCVTPEGRKDRLTESLRGAGLDVVVTDGANAPLTSDALDGFRAVVLEDVPAADLTSRGMEALAAWTTDQGGGLLMTGGRASFGPGGYHLSPVADVLPVSLEMRQEHRKFALAMAIVLDRSGSMSVPAPGGPTKMDLANRGAVSAVDLLTAMDSVSVIAVDSEPHVVVPLSPVADRGAIAARVLRIESMGGGIFVAAGLHAAAAQLRSATQGTRHIVLFADAADAEEPGDYATFVPALRKAGVTVSVIGMGSDRDSDADLLKDVARRGGGRIFFAAQAADLPRVFAQETIEVAKSALVEEPTPVATLPELVTVGAFQGLRFPTVGGYTIAYLKPGAQEGLRTQDETKSPLLSFWQRGLGRSAAFLGVADGKLSGGLATWDGYADFFTTLVRWVGGTEAAGEVHATATRRGHEGILTVEVAREREDLLGLLDARVTMPDGRVRPVDLRRAGATRLEGRFALEGTGVHRPAIGIGEGKFLRVAPLALPYSPEFEPRTDPSEGEATLRRVATIAGGAVDPPSGTLFDGSREGTTTRSVAWVFAIAGIVAFLLEILVRRTSWSPRWSVVTARAGARLRSLAWWKGRPAAAPAPEPTAAEIAAATRSRRRPPAREVPPPPPPVEPAPPPAPSPEPPTPGGIASVLDRAKRRRES